MHSFYHQFFLLFQLNTSFVTSYPKQLCFIAGKCVFHFNGWGLYTHVIDYNARTLCEGKELLIFCLFRENKSYY